MKCKLLAGICLLLPLTTVFPVSGCAPDSGFRDSEQARLELIQEIRTFEQEIGFTVTNNFREYSEEVKSYDYYFYTGSLELPYSLGDPLLRFGTGTAANVTLDHDRYDVFFYAIEALAGIGTPVTKSLMSSPLPRFIHVIFHEDWHEQIDLPASIEEPSGEVVSYAAAISFAGARFGEDSDIHRKLRQEFENKLRESGVYAAYYGKLEELYARRDGGFTSEEEALLRKEKLLNEMNEGLKNIWGAKQEQLNNAFIAFQMTYLRYLPLLYQAHLDEGGDVSKTVALFRGMPHQGEKRDSPGEIRRIEQDMIEYLKKPLSVN